MRNLTLKLSDYAIKGIASVIPWGGGEASIEMNVFNVSSLKDIKENLNDSGFGVQEITGAVVEVYRNYQGTLVYSRTLTIGKVFDCVYENEY